MRGDAADEAAILASGEAPLRSELVASRGTIMVIKSWRVSEVGRDRMSRGEDEVACAQSWNAYRPLFNPLDPGSTALGRARPTETDLS